MRWPSQKERFWSNVTKSDGCWTWTGSTWEGGYGRLLWNGKRQGAHRVSWELAHGKPSSDVEVCHTCDNPGCVRPDHLFLGSHSDNMQDMVRKNRHAAITKPDKVPRGDKHGGAKLQTEQINQILTWYRDHHESQRQIAAWLGVSQTVVSGILRGTAWDSVQREPVTCSPTGSRNGRAQLHEAQVLDIRKQFDGGDSRKTLAQRFCVSYATIDFIVTRKTWRHI